MDGLQFEWDTGKAANNLAKHGVSFLTAAGIFANAIIERVDDREEYGELRFIALGRVETNVYRVVYTLSGGLHMAWRFHHSDHLCAESEQE